MTHVVSEPRAPFLSASGNFEVFQVPAAQDNLVWLVACKKSGALAVFDGPDAGGALGLAQRLGLKITHVLNTHTHGDHVGLNRDLAARGLLADMEVIGPRGAARDVPGLTQAVSEGDSFAFGNLSGRVLLTEGHIVGHVSFVLEDVLFCGDALFTAGCGRVFTGDYRASFEGLEKLAQLDPHTQVCCGHEYTLDGLHFARSVEPDNAELLARIKAVAAVRESGGSAVPSTLGEELATNPFMRTRSEALIASLRTQLPHEPLATPCDVFTALRKLKDSGAYKRTTP